MSRADRLDPEAVGWSCYTATPAESLALFEKMRGRCPLAHSDEHEGFHLLLNWREVRGAMSDHRTFSSEPQVLRPMLPRKPIPGLEMDPPRHGAWRAIYNEAIRRATPEVMEPFIRADIRRHVQSFIARGECDIVAELCEPVPAETICHLMGITDSDTVVDVRRTALAMFAAQGDPEAFGQRQAEFSAVTVSEIHDRKTNPRDDFLTYLSGIEVEGRRLDDEDYVVLLAAFLGAGHHSTTSAMASLIAEIFSRPALRDALRADRGRIPAAVEEVLRLRPPFFGFFRRATRDVEVRGTVIEKDGDIYCGWAAANRDPEVFDRPGELDIARPGLRHMTFGFGIHNCPGAPLARLELKLLLEELLELTPDLRLDGTLPDYAFGGGDYAFLPELRVRFTPGEPQRPEEKTA